MSFGGGGQADYRINYIISTRAEGTGAGPINQVSAATDKMGGSMQQASVSAEKMKAAHERVTQAGLGVSKAAKGMAFGFIGMTTAGAEMVGMMSMYQATQDGVKEAQDAVNEALKEGGKGSSEYKKAMQDLAKANRWAQMTFRNLMLSIFDMIPFLVLSVNGILKLRTAMTAMREAKAAEAALKGVSTAVNGVSAASNVGVTATTKFASAQSATAVSTIASTGAFKNNTIALGTGTAATNTAAVATGKLSKAMRVLQTAMKIAIPLVLIEIGSQAYQNNWGGFADKINKVGVAIGNAMPQLKGFLDLVAKVGKSVVAIFTGNWDDIGSIWNPIVQGGEEAKEISEDLQKKIDENKEALLDASLAARDFVTELSAMEGKDMSKILKGMGFKGKGKRLMEDELEQIEKIQEKLQGFNEFMQTLQFDIDSTIFDIPEKSMKKALFTLEDRFDWLAKETGERGFKKFGDVLHKLAKEGASAQEVQNAIVSFFSDKNNAHLLTELTTQFPDLGKMIGDLIEKQELAKKTNEALAKEFGDTVFEDNNIGKDVQDKLGITGATKPGGAGPFQSIVDQIKNGVTALPGQIAAMDWNAIGIEVGNQLDTIFNAETGLKIGNAINTYIIVPAEKFLMGLGSRLVIAAKPWVDEFKKDPIKALFGEGGITAPVGDFVAGILGFASEKTMFTFFQIKLKVAGDRFRQYFHDYFMKQEETKNDPGSGGMDAGQGVWFVNWTTPIIQGIQKGYATFLVNLNTDADVQAARRWFHDPGGALTDFFKNNQSTASDTTKKTAPGSGGMDVGQGEWFVNWSAPIISGIQMAYAKYTIALQENPWVKAFAAWMKDPLGSLINFIKNIVVPALEASAKEEAAALPTYSGDDFLKDTGIQGFIDSLKNTYDQIVTKLSADENIKKLKGFWDGVQKGGQAALDAIWSIITGSGNEAEATEVEPFFKGGGFDMSSPIVVDIPEIIIGGTVYRSAPLPETIDPPVTNTTPTIAIPQASLQPQSATYDLTQVWDDLGRLPDGTAPHGPDDPWGGGGRWPQLRIAIPSAILEPQTYNVDLSQSTIAQDSFGVTSLEAIVVKAEVVRDMVTHTFNTLAATLISLFTVISQQWSSKMNSLGTNAQSAQEQVTDAMNNLTATILSLFDVMANHWSTVANSFINNAEAAGEGITEAIADAMADGESRMSDLADHWSSMCNSLINNAESAADGINDALDSIEDEEVVIHYRTTGSTKPPGKAHGTSGQWVHKPTLFMAGEQGSEFVTVGRAGSGRDTGGGSGSGGSTIHIHQHLLEREVVQILNIDKGRMVSKFGPN